MPWTARDAYSHTKKANTTELQRRWASIANRILSEGGDEASAIRQANAMVAKMGSSKTMKPKMNKGKMP